MPLELKDLATQKPVIVPEEGLTFGREGGDANIQLRDTGVSKRHARVFGENGAWFLEDLGSSNGTWLQKERIKDATELLPGDIFQLSQVKFEVVQVVGNDDEVEATSHEADDPSDAEPIDEHEPTPKPLPAAAAKEPISKPLRPQVKSKVPAPQAPAKKASARAAASAEDPARPKRGPLEDAGAGE